ncbi:U4/U6.U5 tri-snRNP-associated protein 1 [Scyliorhinus torazame]|uniref:U4/U6.U5 tri-snRNP-associated protein 1 n=1 Tax=Scyliorhinus torazame TaxID=75743 RepID=UPI003B58BE40
MGSSKKHRERDRCADDSGRHKKHKHKERKQRAASPRAGGAAAPREGPAGRPLGDTQPERRIKREKNEDAATGGKSGAASASLSIEETNKLRAKLGLKPLRSAAIEKRVPVITNQNATPPSKKGRREKAEMIGRSNLCPMKMLESIIKEVNTETFEELYKNRGRVNMVL